MMGKPQREEFINQQSTPAGFLKSTRLFADYFLLNVATEFDSRSLKRITC